MENSVVKRIDGQDRGFKFNVLTFETFSERTGVEFSEIGKHFAQKPFASILEVVACAHEIYEHGATIDKFEVADWIDEMSDEDFQEIWNAMEMNLKKYTTKFAKKKTTKAKSSPGEKSEK